MLEWLKSILGEGYTEEIDKKVSEQIGKEFVPKTDFDTLTEAKKELDAQIKNRDKQLDELEGMDAAGLQAEIGRLQGENTKAKAEYEDKLRQTQLDYKLESRLIKEGAVNVTAVKALLDGSKISLDGDNLIGVDEQLKTLKESEKWAFAPSAPDVPGSPANPPVSGAEQKPTLPKGIVTF